MNDNTKCIPMFKVMFLTKFDIYNIKEVPAVPRIGDVVDMFYNPMPIVKGVIWYPSENSFGRFGIDLKDVVAIVYVE